jgi:hypothetical protein
MSSSSEFERKNENTKNTQATLNPENENHTPFVTKKRSSDEQHNSLKKKKIEVIPSIPNIDIQRPSSPIVQQTSYDYALEWANHDAYIVQPKGYSGTVSSIQESKALLSDPTYQNDCRTKSLLSQ